MSPLFHHYLSVLAWCRQGQRMDAAPHGLAPPGKPRRSASRPAQEPVPSLMPLPPSLPPASPLSPLLSRGRALQDAAEHAGRSSDEGRDRAAPRDRDGEVRDGPGATPVQAGRGGVGRVRGGRASSISPVFFTLSHQDLAQAWLGSLTRISPGRAFHKSIIISPIFPPCRRMAPRPYPPGGSPCRAP